MTTLLQRSLRSFASTLGGQFATESPGQLLRIIHLKQLNEDSNNNNDHYYQDKYGISTTKQQVLGLGPGLAYLANQRLVLEGKIFWETAARNREQGVRPAMQLSYKF